MFNKKRLIRFYATGIPIVFIWAYIITDAHPEIEDPFFNDGPIRTVHMNAAALKSYKEGRAEYIAYEKEEARKMFWPTVGVGIVWMTMGYGVFIAVRQAHRIYKSRK